MNGRLHELMKSSYSAGSRLVLLALCINGPSTLRQLSSALGVIYPDNRRSLQRMLYPLVDRKVVILTRTQCDGRGHNVYELQE